LASKIAIGALLFGQLTVAAYACPQLTGAPMVSATGTMSAGCDHTGSGSPNLCQQHCAAGDQSVDSVAHPPVPAAANMTAMPLAPYSSIAAVRSVDLPLLLARATAPPALIRFRVIRV
jgi:hypothetical protein